MFWSARTSSMRGSFLPRFDWPPCAFARSSRRNWSRKNMLIHKYFQGFGKRWLDKSQLKRLDCFFAFSVERKLLNTLSRRSRLGGRIKPLTYTSSVVSLDNVRPCVSLTTEVSHKLFQLTLNKRFDNMFSVVNSIRTTWFDKTECFQANELPGRYSETHFRWQTRLWLFSRGSNSATTRVPPTWIFRLENRHSTRSL